MSSIVGRAFNLSGTRSEPSVMVRPPKDTIDFLFLGYEYECSSQNGCLCLQAGETIGNTGW